VAALKHAVYVHNGYGQMVKSVVNGVVTSFAGKHYKRVVNGTAVVVQKTYMLGSRIVAVRTDGMLSFVLTDHLGSTVAMTDESGNLTSRLRYTAFSERREANEDGTPGTKYRYTSKLSQAEAGLIFFQRSFLRSLLTNNDEIWMAK
jgi:hypothetical protein